MKEQILNIEFTRNLNIESNLQKLVKFIIDNRTNIYIDTVQTKAITSFPILSKSPISLIYQKYKNLHNLDIFSLIYSFEKENIPDILFWKYLNIDFGGLKDLYPKHHAMIASFPEYNSSIVFNLSDILNKERTKILNTTYFQKIIVRDLCSRAYSNFDDSWLNGELLSELTNFYSMIISFNISRIYNFSFQEQTLLSTIFSYYFLTKCINDKERKLQFLNTLNFLGNKNIIVSVVSLINDIIAENNFGDIDTQDKLIKTIHEIAPHRITNLNKTVFNTMCRNFNSDQIVSLMSIDYPGYWLYNILTSVSGDKTGLYFIFKKLNVMKKAIVFADNLLNSSEFFKSLRKDY